MTTPVTPVTLVFLLVTLATLITNLTLTLTNSLVKPLVVSTIATMPVTKTCSHQTRWQASPAPPPPSDNLDLFLIVVTGSLLVCAVQTCRVPLTLKVQKEPKDLLLTL